MKVLKLALTLPVVLLLGSASAEAQTVSPRAQELAELFTKRKVASKTKHGVTKSKYKEVVSTPWLVTDPREYAGQYEGESGERITLQVDAGGRVNGSGQDTNGSFQLREGVVRGGVLSATKAYANGERDAFEAAFLQRSDRDSPDDDFTKRIGIGYLEDATHHGIGEMRVFLERR